MIRVLLSALVLIVALSSCHNEKRKAVYYETDSEAYNESSSDIDDGTIAIPFSDRNGQKYVDVKVNGIGFEMVFDTGAATTMLSLAEAKYLFSKGLLTKEDICGTTSVGVADGSVSEGLVVNLREVVIGDKIICRDVEAVVSQSTQSPLLLGNEVLDRVATYTINNETETINFKLK